MSLIRIAGFAAAIFAVAGSIVTGPDKLLRGT
jgi:hypothetical protein